MRCLKFLMDNQPKDELKKRDKMFFQAIPRLDQIDNCFVYDFSIVKRMKIHTLNGSLSSG